ncbi:DUF4160 domain-containing protein [Bacteroidota bacterium]
MAKKDRLEVQEAIEKYKTSYNMPELSRFYGIIIAIFYDDHDPPHFHAFYNEYVVRVEIRTGKQLSGTVPSRVFRLIEEWRNQHIEDLKKAWEDVQNHQPPAKISPLD